MNETEWGNYKEWKGDGHLCVYKVFSYFGKSITCGGKS